MRPVVENLEESRIREVANEGLGRPDVLKFWFGESDEAAWPWPSGWFVRRAWVWCRASNACRHGCGPKVPTTDQNRLSYNAGLLFLNGNSRPLRRSDWGFQVLTGCDGTHVTPRNPT
jgi:hypothetical protein